MEALLSQIDTNFCAGRLTDLASAAAAAGLQLWQLAPQVVITWGVAAGALQQAEVAKALLTHYLFALQEQGQPPNAADCFALCRLVAVRLTTQQLQQAPQAQQWVRAAPFLTQQQQEVLLEEITLVTASPAEPPTSTSSSTQAIPDGPRSNTAGHQLPQQQQQSRALPEQHHHHHHQQQASQQHQQPPAGQDVADSDYCMLMGELDELDFSELSKAAAAAPPAAADPIAPAGETLEGSSNAAGSSCMRSRNKTVVPPAAETVDSTLTGDGSAAAGGATGSPPKGALEQPSSSSGRASSALQHIHTAVQQQATWWSDQGLPPAWQLLAAGASAGVVGYSLFRERRVLQSALRRVGLGLVATASMALGLTPDVMGAVPSGRVGL